MAHNHIASEHAAHQLFAKGLDEIGDIERKVLERAAQRKLVSRDINRVFADELTFGERLADKSCLVRRLMNVHPTVCSAAVPLDGREYIRPASALRSIPHIFLNLLLSMLAAIQATVIMMSHNRQSVQDRLDASHDYEVNLKAEIEILALHEKLDQLRTDEVEKLLIQQKEQIELLTGLLTTFRASRQSVGDA